jgi:hypothetical protein
MAWRLADCPTNQRTWVPDWERIRGQPKWARRGDLVALNAFGTVALYDVCDPRDVVPVGRLKLPDLAGKQMDEDYPIGFDREGRVLQTSGPELYVVDVADPKRPQLVETRPLDPPLHKGGFVDGVLYHSTRDAPGVWVRDGAAATKILPELEPVGSPYAYAHVGDYLYAINGLDELIVVRRADGTRVRAKQASVAYNVDVLDAPAVQMIVLHSGTDTRIVDVAKPDNPKLQKKIYKRGARGGGVAGELLYLVDGEYQEAQFVTTVRLARPVSEIVSREPFTTDRELGSNLNFIAATEHGLLVMTHTARFALVSEVG